jgi:3-dehydroquinate synthase
MEKIVIHPSPTQASTELYFGENLLAEGPLIDLSRRHRGKVVVIADHALQDLYGISLAQRLHAALITISSKNREAQEHVHNELFKMGCGRDTLLIALGGGTTTDLVGFVASIYLRGVPLILVPTTLLGLVDAAIGGKTAIDTSFGKNLIGTIYHPKAIIADLEILKTLPERERLKGVAEILKMGLVYDPSMWQLAQTQEVIFKAIKGKIAIIERDPMEQGLRRILNFGHTIGHALELVSQYALSHGEAVAIGCLAEAHLSMCLGYLPEEAFERILASYRSFALQLPPCYTRQDLFKAMVYDKKNAMGKVRFVLIDQIGHALPFEGEYCRPVSEKELETTCSWMEKEYG